MEYRFSEHEVAMLAAEVEAKGQTFYRNLQSRAGDRTMADLYGFLAGEEQRHEATFRAIAEAHAGADDGHLYAVDIRAMLKASIRQFDRFFDDEGVATRNGIGVSAGLALAAECEARAVTTYQHMRRVYTSRFSGLLDDVIGEERKHLTMIENAQAQWRQTLGAV